MRNLNTNMLNTYQFEIGGFILTMRNLKMVQKVEATWEKVVLY